MKYTADFFKMKLATDNQWLERGILAIWKYQTRDEKSDTTTKYHNMVGFNGTDGKFLTSLGNWLNTGRHLSEKQIFVARKKMPKYAGQLLRIVEGNN